MRRAKGLLPVRMGLVAFSVVATLSTMTTLRAEQPASKEDAPQPLIRAHAHNDYEHDRPLFDALDNGFCSVEADIYLIDGKLLVAHNRSDVRPERTLEALYLKPLRERVKQNGGRVYRDGPEFTLLVDIKSDGPSTYTELHHVLAGYQEMLTTVADGKQKPGAVSVIISGSRPIEIITAQPQRFASIDGRPSDLPSTVPAHLIPLVSTSWGSEFRWRGQGPMPEAEREKLHKFVEQAHERGRRVRFWATPENEALWKELFAADVDLLNTDNLPGLRQFLSAPERSATGR